jgi:multiple sugar transport system ATP-binding protein
MRAEIKKLQARLGITAIYVTHDQIEAMTMGHRIAVLHAGILQQVGAPLELYERPANLFVAAFIGSPPMNFAEATIQGGGTSLQARGFSVPAPEALRPALAGRDGDGVTLGVRPENLVPAGRAPRGPAAPLQVTVEIAEPLGDEVVVHARLGEDAMVFKQDPHQPAPIGAVLDVQLELDALHLFDAKTTLRIVGR